MVVMNCFQNAGSREITKKTRVQGESELGSPPILLVDIQLESEDRLLGELENGFVRPDLVRVEQRSGGNMEKGSLEKVKHVWCIILDRLHQFLCHEIVVLTPMVQTCFACSTKKLSPLQRPVECRFFFFLLIIIVLLFVFC